MIMTSRRTLLIPFVLAIAIVGGIPSPSEASLVTLAHQNTVIEIDPDSQTGMYTWRVDGTDNLFQQWFWYRIAGYGPESSIDTISAATVTGFGGTNQGTLTYENATLRIDVTYQLTGGLFGTRTSELAEQVTITNKSVRPYYFHLFEYTDFDLGGTSGDDTVVVLSPTSIIQTDANTGLFGQEQTSGTPAPSHYEVNQFSATRDSLNDELPTTLNDANGPIGPSDVTWAFQWDVKVPKGGSVVLSTTLVDPLLPVPEPATLLIIAVGAAGIGFRRFAHSRRSTTR